MQRLSRLILLLILAGAAFLGWHFREPLADLYHKIVNRSASGENDPRKGTPDPVRYQELIKELEAKRLDLSKQYQQARTAQDITRVIRDSRKTLDEFLPAMMRCWLGTDWDLNGTCSTPGSGKIACGYFVSTILQDAGFKVERYKLAQQASQKIIGTFLPRNQMHVRAGKSYDDFLQEVVSRGPGIRIVGLDKHVAFLVVQEDSSIRFIHSSGGEPYCVVDEGRHNATALKNSKYRVTGEITGNDDVIHRWLIGDRWPTQL
ncbi:MAG: hypothetical protein ACON38_13400 [Akkermansiaceae bacterium]